MKCSSVSHHKVEPGMLVTDVNHKVVGTVVGLRRDGFAVKTFTDDVLTVSSAAVFGVDSRVQLICSAARIHAYLIE